MVWRNNLTYGFISPNDNREAPFNELFLLGGANTIRGFNWFSIDARSTRKKRTTKSLQSTGGDQAQAARRRCARTGAVSNSTTTLNSSSL